MKVIFLDIDGVMNSTVFYKKRHQKRWFKPVYYWYLIKKLFNIKVKPIVLANYVIPDSHYTFKYLFKRLKKETCKDKWKWLSEYCNKNNVRICISSVWKNYFCNKDGLLNIERWALAFELLGFHKHIFAGITGKRQLIRGKEIKNWLNNNQCEDYAILDDDSDMLPEQMSKFYHCDNYFGLTPNHLYRINSQFIQHSMKVQ